MIVRSAFLTIAALAVIYASTAFVKWDMLWLADVADWKAGDRFGLLYGFGCLVAVCLMCGAAWHHTVQRA